MNAGLITLQSISGADKFNQWMFETIQPFVHGSILEIGSGIGNISSFFLEQKFIITLSDYEDLYITHLKTKFARFPNLQGVIKIDLEHPDFSNCYISLKEKFKTVFLLNVLEHLKDDDMAIANAKLLLEPNGTLIVLTPSYQFLFCSLDKELGHYRRYTLKKLKTVFIKNNFQIKKCFYFNVMGIFGWLYSKIFKLKSISSNKMRLFNKLTSLGKLLDSLVFKKAGLSAIVIAKK